MRHFLLSGRLAYAPGRNVMERAPGHARPLQTQKGGRPNGPPRGCVVKLFHNNALAGHFLGDGQANIGQHGGGDVQPAQFQGPLYYPQY